jgi:hypothetical protein
MNFIKDNFMWILIIALLAGGNGVLFKSTSDKDKELIRVNGELYELLSTVVDTVYVENIITEYKSGETIFVEVEVPVEVLIPVDIDTLSILKDYYSTRVYKDTLNLVSTDLESLGYVAVTDTISENKIVGRYFYANILERVITETTIVKELPKTEIWAGLTSSTNMNIGTSFSLITKQKNHFGVDVGIFEDDGNLRPYLGVRYLWQIK